MTQRNQYFRQSPKAKLLILASLLALGSGQFAFADQITFTSGGLTGTITANGSCVGNGCASLSADLNPITGQTTVTGSINGWAIGPKEEDSRINNELENVFGVQCIAAAGCAGANDLDIKLTDSNFSPATGEFSLAFSDTQAGIGTATESAYFDANNRPFAETTLIGTLGPFAADSTFTIEKLVDKASPRVFSMTLDQTFSAADGTSFIGIGDIAAVAAPEPTSLTLLLAALSLVAVGSHRKTKASS